MNARKIGACIFAALTFFLTGCAGGRYHKAFEKNAPARGIAVPSFRWPIEGRVAVPFGAPDEGVSVKGLWLEGSEGAPVVAASDGVVTLSDPSLRGYGKTIIIEHDAVFSTVYAGSAEILALTGQRVKQGQTIASLGRAGKGGRPQLYFELRRATRPEDPQKYLH